MARVVIEHLTKVFPGANGQSVAALRELSLTIEDQELLVLVGPSGCGKTTTLRLLAGLEVPTAGTIAIDGQVVNCLPPKARDMAMVFQNPALYPHLTTYENLAFGLKVRRLPKSEIERRVRQAADLLSLGDCLHRLPMSLSGGQRQRVAVGRAVVRRPKVFLLDEPLSGLDLPMRIRMRSELARLQADLAATMLYVTHDQVEAMALGDRVAVLREGVLQQVDEPRRLYQHPANRFVAGFVGSPPMNFFSGGLVRAGSALVFQADAPAGAPVPLRFSLPEDLQPSLAGLAEQPITLGLRPEHISEAQSAPDVPTTWRIKARVETAEPLGPETYLRATTSGLSFVARVPATAHAGPNEELLFVFDLRQAHLFETTTEKALV